MTHASDDPRHCAIRLHAAVARLTRELRSSSPPSDLGSAGLSVLALLHRHGELSPSTLAAHEGVRLQTLTRLLGELEGAGLARRRADPADARRSLLALTPAGARQLAVRVHGRESSLQAALAEALSAAERRLLLQASELLEQVAAHIAAHAARSEA